MSSIMYSVLEQPWYMTTASVILKGSVLMEQAQ